MILIFNVIPSYRDIGRTQPAYDPGYGKIDDPVNAL
jgi:alpha/beta superfamily hydrolase